MRLHAICFVYAGEGADVVARYQELLSLPDVREVLKEMEEAELRREAEAARAAAARDAAAAAASAAAVAAGEVDMFAKEEEEDSEEEEILFDEEGHIIEKVVEEEGDKKDKKKDKNKKKGKGDKDGSAMPGVRTRAKLHVAPKSYSSLVKDRAGYLAAVRYLCLHHYLTVSE